MTIFSTLDCGGSTGFAVPKSYSGVYLHEIRSVDVIALPQVAGDFVTAFNIPANTYVEFLQAEIVDADMTGCTRVDIGYNFADGTTDDDDYFVANAATLTEGTDLTIAAATKFFPSAATIDVKYTTGTLTGTGSLRLVVRLTDLSRKEIARIKTYTN